MIILILFTFELFDNGNQLLDENSLCFHICKVMKYILGKMIYKAGCSVFEVEAKFCSIKIHSCLLNDSHHLQSLPLRPG